MRPILAVLLASLASVHAAAIDPLLAKYFEQQVSRIEEKCLNPVPTKEQWENQRPELRQQLFEMLSLDPLPPKSDLKPVVTGTVERDDFRVEKLHFQSMPGLYATANLYLPKKVEGPLPTILYLCGHGVVKTNGISYGNKVTYQHHGAWFARNGYACLLIDTIQLGEIEGVHHGSAREGMWWWNSRGYTPAGVEAWNCIRALDYLETRPEVDKTRFGVTGRSGGGAYSWWITALDERIKVSAPVAGITDLRNHVVDGVVEGHCDCMYIVNTHQWDYPLLAALAAPRPLMIANSDRDYIFPLDGVQRLHQKVAAIYGLYKKPENLAFLITPGPHKDTQDLQVPVFRWFNKHLKNNEPLIEMAATKFFSAQELKVFEKLPADERTSKIHDTFVAPAKHELTATAEEWSRLRTAWLADLRSKVFAGWPEEIKALNPKIEDSSSQVLKISFTSQENVPLELHLRVGGDPKRVSLMVVAQDEISSALDRLRSQVSDPDLAIALLAPRGAGPELPKAPARDALQIRRRYMLLGQTLDSMRVWDICRGIELLRTLPQTAALPIELSASGHNSVNALYAAIFQPVDYLSLSKLPSSHQEGADYLNVLRILDIPQALALAPAGTTVLLDQSDPAVLNYARSVREKFGAGPRIGGAAQLKGAAAIQQ